MNIIIISYAFPPIKHISANRPYRLAKYFFKAGHKVLIITADPAIGELMEEKQLSVEFTKVFRIKYKKYTLAFLENKKSIILKKISGLINYFFKISNEFLWFKQSNFHINEIVEEYKSIDLIISTSPIYSTIMIGHKLHNNFPESKFIIDFRDSPFLPSIMSKYRIFITKAFLKYYITRCDLITVVSEGIKESLISNYKFKSKSEIEKIHVIYNGFDNDEKKEVFMSHKHESNKFIISYTGTLYNGRRDCSLLFDAIRELIDNNFILTSEIQIQYAGDDVTPLVNQAKKFDLQDIILDCGLVSLEQSHNIQYSSDCILVVSWNYKSEKGILTGKFAEALLFNKNILALVSGNEPNSEMEKIVQKYNLGYSGNYIYYKNSKKELLDFLCNKLVNKRMKMSSDLIISNECLEQFDYEILANRLLKLLN